MSVGPTSSNIVSKLFLNSAGAFSPLKSLGVAGLAVGGVALGMNMLRSLFQSGTEDGAYNAAGQGIGGMNGYSASTNGTWSDVGWALQHPVQATVNSGLKLADTLTLGMIPALGRARLDATANNATDIGKTIAAGGYDKSFSSGYVGDVIGGTLSAEENAMLGHLDPKDRARYLLQKKMQEKAEMAALLSNLQAMRHSVAMQVINNIRQ